MVKIKKLIDNNTYKIQLSDEQEHVIQLEYGGADLYWIMQNYYPNNSFIISKADEYLFSQMTELFKIISEHDNPYDKVFKNDCFEWLSEEYGLPENAHKLVIKKNAENYTISFFNNPNHLWNFKNSCYICFCLSGSKNPTIAYAFSTMFLEYKNIDSPKILQLEHKKSYQK